MILTADEGRQNKIHVSIDGEYSFTVDADFWFSSGFSSGDEIGPEELEEMLETIAVRRCFNRALNILSRRDHCERELLVKLRRTDSEETARLAVERVKALGLINEERYAVSLAEELRERKGMGAGRIRLELQRRGVDRCAIDEALDALEDDDDYEKLRSLCEKKYHARLGDEKGRRQVTAALARLGYGYSEIKQAIDDHIEEHRDEYEPDGGYEE